MNRCPPLSQLLRPVAFSFPRRDGEIRESFLPIEPFLFPTRYEKLGTRGEFFMIFVELSTRRTVISIKIDQSFEHSFGARNVEQYHQINYLLGGDCPKEASPPTDTKAAKDIS